MSKNINVSQIGVLNSLSMQHKELALPPTSLSFKSLLLLVGGVKAQFDLLIFKVKLFLVPEGST